ncbi:mediator of RNA polymerase II transcription subunit 1 [Caerostris extrusa]|uniref:Mediator of RNA polymerase II transcription subunit 1 n=1 Tax=Caerostris extrusa TaxID=172846 RepID=A0AAV4TRH3_CAEEX|nr:mediator of RNA polymerase II transcription subunit 1 [Caerostris extrusa]
MLEMKSYLAASEAANYSDSAAIPCDIDMEDDNSFSMDSNPSTTLAAKHESISSDESSIGEMSQKSFSEAENSQSEDSSTSSKSNTSHISPQVFLAKRSTSSLESSESSGKKKSDAKKEKKRRKAESSGNVSGRSPVRPLHLNIDSSLMPPPSSTSETSTVVSSSDTQPIRPITLNVKTSPISSSNSSFQAKSPVYSKKSSSLSSSSSSVSKSISGSESESKRSSNSTTVKIQSKHKQSSSSKSNSSSSGSTHSGGRSSPSKPKSATLKFKSYPVSSSVTLTPIVTKVTSSPTSMSAMASSDSLVMQTSVVNPPSPTGKNSSGNSKSNKSVVRSRSLNAVIDKLKVSASNAQYSIPDGLDNLKCERSESKSKYSSSEQFTVKQSSQGIKLTVTKTRSGDGSSKSSKSKQSTKSSSGVTSSSSSSISKATSSSGSSSSKSGNVSPASKKIYSSSNVSVSTKVTTSSSNQPKQNPTSSQKISSPSNSSAMSPRTGNSANNLSKSISKHITSSSQSKVSGSNKVFDKEKKSLNDLKIASNEIKDNISSSSVNIISNLMPPPTLSKPVGDSSRSSSSGNTPKRIEDNSRQSPRHIPTLDASLDELDNERAFFEFF